MVFPLSKMNILRGEVAPLSDLARYPGTSDVREPLISGVGDWDEGQQQHACGGPSVM
jgi:hypothetical protein